MRIAVSGPGTVVGEMGLVSGELRNATVRALTDVRLFEIPRACLDDLLATSVAANRALFDVFISRWREQESRVRQSERMAQIGVLAAGLAHEMNNPAAAVSSGAARLEAVLDRVLAAAAQLGERRDVPTPSRAGVVLGPLERADVEDGLEEALERLGVDEPWHHAAILTDAGFVPEDIDASRVDAAAVAFASLDAEARSLMAEVAEGAHRLSELVGAMKSYSFLDRAPIQDVDVVRGIEDTLLILRSKLGDIRIERDYADDLPAIPAHGSQLNQVWTNLIDNAADAIRDAGVDDGRIVVRARHAGDDVVVEVENNGPAIPPDVIDRIFEAFFTTKAPGQGTGLGLDTVWDIVVNQHRGDVGVASSDGSTIFTVTLPIGRDDTV